MSEIINGVNGRKRFSLQLDFGNILQIVLMITGMVYFAARIENHLGDAQIHQTIAEKERAFDDRFNLRVEPLLIEIRQLKVEVERLNRQLSYREVGR